MSSFGCWMGGEMVPVNVFFVQQARRVCFGIIAARNTEVAVGSVVDGQSRPQGGLYQVS